MQRANSPTTRHRNAAYSKKHRDKKKEGNTRKQRTLAERAALLARPYAELSDQEKELVRYYRKAAKRQAAAAAIPALPAAAAAAAVSSPPPPPTRSPSPAPPAVRRHSMLLNGADMADILGNQDRKGIKIGTQHREDEDKENDDQSADGAQAEDTAQNGI